MIGGFANNEDPETLGESLYTGCEATDDTTAVITLSRPLVRVPFGDGHAVLSPSPARQALEEGGADDVSGTAEAPTFDGTFGYENPVGTGPSSSSPGSAAASSPSPATTTTGASRPSSTS